MINQEFLDLTWSPGPRYSQAMGRLLRKIEIVRIGRYYTAQHLINDYPLPRSLKFRTRRAAKKRFIKPLIKPFSVRLPVLNTHLGTRVHTSKVVYHESILPITK